MDALFIRICEAVANFESVSDFKAAKRIIECATDNFGKLNIVVNNAGISVRVAIDDDAYDEAWAKGLAVMLTAHQRIIRTALPYLRQSKS